MADATVVEGSTGIRATHGRRDFHLFWLAGAADNVGSKASAVVFPLLVLAVSGSAVVAGVLASVARVADLLASPLAGVLADRWSRRTMMVVSALVAAVATATVLLVILLDRVSIFHLAVVAAVQGVAEAFYGAGAQGAIRRILPQDDSTRALSRLHARDHAAQLLGPMIGGALFQVGRWLPFLLDAVSFVVAAICVRAIRADLRPAQRTESAGASPSLLRDLVDGLRFVIRQPFLRFVTIWAGGMNFVLLALYYHTVLTSALHGSGAWSIALIMSISSIGGLAGSLLVPRLLGRVRPATVVVGLSWVMVPTVAAFALASQTWAYGLLLGILFLVVPAISVVLQSRVITTTPDGLLGRVGIALTVIPGLFQLFAPVAAGLTVTVYSSTSVALTLSALLIPLVWYATANVAQLSPPAHSATEPLT